jgi:hypothetical protein
MHSPAYVVAQSAAYVAFQLSLHVGAALFIIRRHAGREPKRLDHCRVSHFFNHYSYVRRTRSMMFKKRYVRRGGRLSRVCLKNVLSRRGAPKNPIATLFAYSRANWAIDERNRTVEVY